MCSIILVQLTEPRSSKFRGFRRSAYRREVLEKEIFHILKPEYRILGDALRSIPRCKEELLAYILPVPRIIEINYRNESQWGF